MTNKKRSMVLGGIITAVLAIVLSACSSSGSSPSSTPAAGDSSSGSTATGGSDSGGVAKAKQLLAQYEKNPTEIGQTEPISKPIPKGKNITFLDCGITSCQTHAKVLQSIATALGWTFTDSQAGTTPEGIHTAIQRAIQSNTNAIMDVGTPESYFKDFMPTLKAKNIPVVLCCSVEPSGNGFIDVVGNTQELANQGARMADYIVADSNGKANALFVDNTDLPSISAIRDGFKAEMSSLCPSCPVSIIEAKISAIGTTLPAQLTSYVRAHPKIDYIANSIDSMATGLPTALKNAGLANSVKFVGQSSDLINKQYVANGQQAATVPFAQWEANYREMDTLARYFAGVPYPAKRTPLPNMIFDKNNIGKQSLTQPSEPLVNGLQDQYYKLWGLK